MSYSILVLIINHFLSLSLFKKTDNKIKSKPRKKKLNKTKYVIAKQKIHYVCLCWPTTPGQGPALECD